MSGLATVLAAGAFGVLAKAEVFFEERFSSPAWEDRWVQSRWKGGNGPAGKFEWSAGKWAVDENEQKGLRTAKDMHYHSASAKLEAPFSNKGKDLVVQFSVKHEAQEFSFCGGGYIKLMSGDFDQGTFGGNTPYYIMFGPDICGYDVARIHLIFNFEGENLLRRADIGLDYDDKNEYTHLYTLVVKPNSTYKVFFDMKEKSSGSLHDHWDFPNKTSDDPMDQKPASWTDARLIDDPAKTRPADWVTEARMRDPTATQPAEWDEEEDGTWEAPMIDNSAYKGEWVAGQIANPEYKGEWKAKQLDNPKHVADVYRYDNIGAVGFELWTVNNGTIFDNVLVADSFEHAQEVAEIVWKPFSGEKEKEAKNTWQKASGIDPDNYDSPEGLGEDEDGEDKDHDAEEVNMDGGSKNEEL